ncbi:hypothetical protein R3P38DRAFT_2578539, partial [Favolaschia claudopus]
AIETVADWLQTFRAATTEMSRTSRPMLSSTHSTFRGLQKILKDKIGALPPNASPELREGLARAHLKLSDYYYKFDQSPFYIWAAREFEKDYASDPDLKSYLEVQTDALRRYFDDRYPALTPTTSAAAASRSNSVPSRSESSFAALDQGSDDEEEADELQRYFEAPRSAVAVERVFSGGRDAISLRRARLQPETIRTLMLVKHHLRLKRTKLQEQLNKVDS